MSETSDYQEDRELEQVLSKMAQEGRLVDYLTDLLVEADAPDIEINGVAVALKAANPPISDKSCYKKCLKEDTAKGGTYKKCIKKCKKTLTLSIDLLSAT